MAKAHFADRLFEAARSKRSQVVVGLDPRPELLPEEFDVRGKGRAGGAKAIADSIAAFNKQVIDAVADAAVAVKCQIAFYECLGMEGLRAYKETIELAREHGLLVIGDVKRNDIGSTARAYARAHLPGDGADDFHVDAVTVNPLFGSDGIFPFIERAKNSGSGVFVLVRTSNPSSEQVQELECDSRPVYQHLASFVHEWGADCVGECGYSLVGSVVGATFPDQLSYLRRTMPAAPLLIPGYGAQGGGAEDAMGGFDSEGSGAVVNSSRGIIYAYRSPPYADRFGERAYKDAIRAAVRDMQAALQLALKQRSPG